MGVLLPLGAALTAALAAVPSPPLPSPSPPAAVHYRAPVEGRVVDPFRPPSTPYAAGNRGLDYAVAPGTPVGAAAAGVVTFAGQVGRSLDVVILHADRLRTTYSGLADIAVTAGEEVQAGQPV